jgi:hypothetical protein
LISLISYISAIVGGLAQMARALVWQTRGHRFDSGILHDVGFYTFIFPRSRIAEKEKSEIGGACTET